ncbi:MAG: isoprenyl transferase [Atribacterota bacterium]
MLKNSRKYSKQQLLKEIPSHLAIIMDGNGRWARRHNLPRFAGHQAGLKTVKMVITESIKAGVKILTIYAFSTENWKRSKNEINALMTLFQEVIEKEKKDLIENKIKVRFIGHKENLSNSLNIAMTKLEEETIDNNSFFLNIAINYGGRSELCQAFQTIYQKITDGEIKNTEISDKLINQYLFTANMPDPDLLIRTGGEKRISNFLLWQIAYTELWFTKTFWPDFSKENLRRAFTDYKKRVRKFGGEV